MTAVKLIGFIAVAMLLGIAALPYLRQYCVRPLLAMSSLLSCRQLVRHIVPLVCFCSLVQYAATKPAPPTPTSIWTLKYHSNNGKGDLTSQNFVQGKEQRLYYMNSRLGWEYKDEDGFNYVFMGWAKSPTGGRDLVEYQEFRPNIAKTLLWLDSGLGWTRSGYDFMGWAKSPTSTAVVYANGQTVNNLVAQGQTLHLYAVWRDRRWTIRYHRNYSSDDDEYEDQKIPVGASVKLFWLDSQLGWTRDGYWFKGWAKSRTGGAVYQNGQTVKDLAGPGEVLHIYGAWGKKSN